MMDRLSPWANLRIETEDYRELDDERLLVLTRSTGQGTASGVAVRRKSAALFHIDDGKVTRLVAYFERDRALADLGLAPEAESR